MYLRSPRSDEPVVQSPRYAERLQFLCRWFARSDGQRGVCTITAVGEFIPSSLHLVDGAIREFMRFGLLDRHTSHTGSGRAKCANDTGLGPK